MARKRVVSRTITETVATIMYANAQTQTFENKDIRVQGEYATPADLMKVVNKKFKYAGLVPISVLSWAAVETLYEMDEDDFIRCARIVPGGR